MRRFTLIVPATIAAVLIPTVASAHTVEPGDTLYELTEDNYGSADWSTIEAVAAHNGISDPNLILVGDELEFPELSTHDSRVESPDDFTGEYDDPPVTESYGWTVWDDLAECESGGDWGISTGNGYYGGLQFSLGSWQAAGGSGYPHENSRDEQIRVAENLLDMQGWGAWPSCSAQLGL